MGRSGMRSGRDWQITVPPRVHTNTPTRMPQEERRAGPAARQRRVLLQGTGAMDEGAFAPDAAQCGPMHP